MSFCATITERTERRRKSMKRKGFAFLAAVIASQLLLSGAATVSVSAESDGIGEAYTAPESPAVTYNMNLDWKFYDTH